MFKKAAHIASVQQLREKTKATPKEAFVYMWDYNLTEMNETELLALQRNVAELDEEIEAQNQMRGFLLRKIILTRRVLYLSYLLYKAQRYEDIQMMEPQFHRMLFEEEQSLQRKKWWKKLTQFFIYLWKARPLLLKDQKSESKTIYLHEEKIIQKVRTNQYMRFKKFKFTERISISAEHKKLNVKYKHKSTDKTGKTTKKQK